ncbi:MAG: metal-dependent hydrolase [Candidatus Aenigmatarchaeota archaeon]
MDLLTHVISSTPLLFPFLFKTSNKNLYILLLFPIFSILPDIDYLIGIEHRALTHSLLFLVIIIFTSFSFWKISKKIEIIALPILYALHIMLDVFSGGVKLFYPFSTTTISFEREITYYFFFTTTKIDLLIVFYASYVFLWIIVFSRILK